MFVLFSFQYVCYISQFKGLKKTMVIILPILVLSTQKEGRQFALSQFSA